MFLSKDSSLMSLSLPKQTSIKAQLLASSFCAGYNSQVVILYTPDAELQDSEQQAVSTFAVKLHQNNPHLHCWYGGSLWSQDILPADCHETVVSQVRYHAQR